jgi:phosphoenolpyruvate---glycerone phosphotransferase subunit DhaL
MSGFINAGAGTIVREIAEVIVANKAFLSEIDGKVGDGDHGNNMAKGFARAAGRIEDDDTLDQGFSRLSDVLMSEIGGSMGPLYGMMFADMAAAIKGRDMISADDFLAMLETGRDAVVAIGSAKVGDKTLLDTLFPAVDAFRAEGDFSAKLNALKQAAAAGRDSTKDMVAKVGRASRLGERSRGVLDAGATSCCLILSTLADGAARRLN